MRPYADLGVLSGVPLRSFWLEFEAGGDADAVEAGGVAPVGEPPHVVDTEYVEDIFQAYACFHVGARHADVCRRFLRETEEIVVQIGAVAVRKMPPPPFYADDFPQT